jgi:hypothetical protein
MQAVAQKGATAAADTQIQQQVDPLQAQVNYQTNLGNQQNAALDQEFNQLLPYSQQAAAMTGEFNQQASSDSQAIFQAAGAQLNAQAQNAGTQAQQLAQQTGGPVSTGQFTDTLAPYQAALAQSGEIGGLATLQLGQIGTDQANQFSGEVLPAMALQQHVTVNQTIAAQKQQLEDQITQIQGTKSKLIADALPGLLTDQLNYYKDQATVAETRWKDAQNVAIQNRKLDQADNSAALASAKQIYDQWYKGAMVTIAGKKESFAEWASGQKITQADINSTFNQWLQGQKLSQQGQKIAQTWTSLGIKQSDLQARINHMSNEDKATAERLGISAGQLALGELKLAENTKIAQERVDTANAKNTNSLIQAMLGGSTSNKPVTVTQKHYLDPKDPLAIQAKNYAAGGLFSGKPPANVFYDPKANNGQGAYYTYSKSSMTPAQFAQQDGTSGTSITDPNAMYRYVLSASPGINKTMVVNAIRLHLGLPKWSPGEPANYTTATLNQMSLPDLTSLAVAHGFPASPVKVGKQRLIDYLQTSLGMKSGSKVKTAATKPAAASQATTGYQPNTNNPGSTSFNPYGAG